MTSTPATPATPTQKLYTTLQDAYDYFNRELFASELPQCLITMQRHKSAAGFYFPTRFVDAATAKTVGTKTTTDEIAINPQYASRGNKEVISTLVHEMCHLWQHHFGQPSANGYHNKQWAQKMKAVGLHPSDTGEPDGKETGSKMTHYIISDGLYQEKFAEFESNSSIHLYQDRGLGRDGKEKKKDKTKLKHECPNCGQKCWGKLGLKVMCSDCDEPMECEFREEDLGEDQE